MASVSACSTLHSTCINRRRTHGSLYSHSLTIPMRARQFQANLRLKSYNKKLVFEGMRRLRSSEEETLVTEQESEEVQEQETVASESGEQQPVSVPVSPSDKLTMHFQADGTMNETAIPTVTKALELIVKPCWNMIQTANIVIGVQSCLYLEIGRHQRLEG